MNRNIEEFFCLTPRRLFAQIDMHVKYNTPSDDKDKKGNKKVEYHQGGTEWM